MDRIAIVGAGLVGRAWAIVFARVGHPVAVYDNDGHALAANLRAVDAAQGGDDLQALGLGYERRLSTVPFRQLVRGHADQDPATPGGCVIEPGEALRGEEIEDAEEVSGVLRGHARSPCSAIVTATTTVLR